MDPNQPSGPDAPTGTPSQANPQGPSGATGADAQPAANTLTFDSFTEEQKDYLKGQGITKQEELTPENLAKVISHARSSQQTAAQRQAELDKLRGPTGPAGTEGQPQNGASGATGVPSDTQQQPDTLDELTLFNLSTGLASSYPKLATKFADGSFFTEMANDGFSVANADGKPNLTAIRKYADFATKQADIAEKEAELNKAPEIPDADSNSKLSAVDAQTPMSVAIARNIILNDKSNPRFAEAQKFLQDAGNKKS